MLGRAEVGQRVNKSTAAVHDVVTHAAESRQGNARTHVRAQAHALNYA